jgi:hypothetical protein
MWSSGALAPDNDAVKLFLSIAGALAWMFGAMLLFAPAQFY